MKNNNRVQILQRLVNKSDQLLDDIAKLGTRIYPTHPKLHMFLDQPALFSPLNTPTNVKERESGQTPLT